VCSFYEEEHGENSLKIMEHFVNHPNFDVNYKDRYGFALIHYCVRMQNYKFLEILLRSGRRDINVNILFGTSSNPNNKNKIRPDFLFSIYNGSTALNILLKHFSPFPFRHIKLQLLLDHGADPNIIGEDGYGPIHNLIRYWRRRWQNEFCDEMMSLLLLAPHDSSTTTTTQQQQEQTIIIKADPNLPFINAPWVMFTPLHIAVMSCCPPYVFDILLRGGADVTLRDGAGRTPLQYADSIHFNDAAVRKLLKEYDPVLRERRRLAGVTLWRRLEHNRDLYSKIYRESGLL